jgi:hypothetical protein
MDVCCGKIKVAASGSDLSSCVPFLTNLKLSLPEFENGITRDKRAQECTG